MLALALLLGGCAGLRSAGPTERQLEEQEVIRLIDYAQRSAGMTAEVQRREYAAINQQFARSPNPDTRMRLALLLGTPGGSVQDADRAARLLEPMAATGDGAGPLRALARLLHAQLSERTREQQRNEQLRNQLETRKEAENSMRKQLDELKEVERAILQRTRESQSRHR